MEVGQLRSIKVVGNLSQNLSNTFNISKEYKTKNRSLEHQRNKKLDLTLDKRFFVNTSPKNNSFTRYLVDSCIEDVQGEQQSQSGMSQKNQLQKIKLKKIDNSILKSLILPELMSGSPNNQSSVRSPQLNVTQNKSKFNYSSLNKTQFSDELRKDQINQQRQLQIEIIEILADLKQMGTFEDNQEGLISEQIQKLLGKLSQCRGPFQESLEYLEKLLFETTFCNETSVYKKINQYWGRKLIQKNHSYRSLLKICLEQQELLLQRHEEDVRSNNRRIEQLNDEISGLRTQLSTLNRQLEQERQEHRQFQDNIDKMMEQKLLELKIQNNQLKATIANDQQEIKQMKLDYNTEMQIAHQNFQNTLLEISKNKVEQELLLSKQKLEIQRQGNQLEQAYDRNQTSLVALKYSKERIQQMESKVESLYNQNVELGYRANIQYDNLTPRPSFSDLIPYLEEIPKDFQNMKTNQRVEYISDNINKQLQNLNTQLLNHRTQIDGKDKEIQNIKSQLNILSSNLIGQQNELLKRTSIDEFDPSHIRETNENAMKSVDSGKTFQASNQSSSFN